MSTIGQLNPSPRMLLGPDPATCIRACFNAMATPLLGHLDPQFLELMNQTQDMLRDVFLTRNGLTFPVSGTGSAGMETCVVNLIEPGDKMLVCVNGVFGQRMAEVPPAGASVTTIERPWGEVFQPDEIRGCPQEGPAQGAGDCACRDVNRGHAAHGRDRRPLPGGRRSSAAGYRHFLGRRPVEIDAWDADAVYSGTQKCLSAPPGLAPVSFSPRALDTINRRKTKVQSWYLDMTLVQRTGVETRFIITPHPLR